MGKEILTKPNGIEGFQAESTWLQGAQKKKKKQGCADRQTVSINGRLETTSVRLADITSVGAKLTQTT